MAMNLDDLAIMFLQFLVLMVLGIPIVLILFFFVLIGLGNKPTEVEKHPFIREETQKEVQMNYVILEEEKDSIKREMLESLAKRARNGNVEAWKKWNRLTNESNP